MDIYEYLAPSDETVTRYCDCGNSVRVNEWACDDCLDQSFDVSNVETAVHDAQLLRDFLVYAQTSGAYKAEALWGLEACMRAFLLRKAQMSETAVNAILDVSDLIALQTDNGHLTSCRCFDCVGAYL